MIYFPRVRRVALAVAVAILATVAVATPAHASPDPVLEPGAQYVALGSSYAAGAGLGPADPGDVGGWCGRTTTAYPTLVAEALGAELTNGTCGGAKIENITTVQQQVVNQSGAHTVPLQIDAVTAETDLVTITIGGNDVNYVGSLVGEACLGDLATNPTSPISNLLKQFGACVPAAEPTIRANLATLEAELVAAIGAVQAKAPAARVVLVDYLTVLPQNGQPCTTAPIPQDRQKFLLEVARDMSLAMKHAAQRTGADFVAASKISRHHDVCSSDPWMIGYDFSQGFVLMHPNAAGHAAVADAVIRELQSPGASS